MKKKYRINCRQLHLEGKSIEYFGIFISDSLINILIFITARDMSINNSNSQRDIPRGKSQSRCREKGRASRLYYCYRSEGKERALAMGESEIFICNSPCDTVLKEINLCLHSADAIALLLRCGARAA